MRIKNLLDQLRDKRAEASILPEEAEPRVRAGVEAIVRNAKQAVESLSDEYKNAVMAHVVLIAVRGPNSKEFADLAEAKMKTLAVDFTAIQTKLISNLVTRNASKTYGQNEHFLVLDEFNRLRIEQKFLSLPAPKIERYNDGIYEAPLELAIPMLIKKNYEGSLFSAMTRRTIGALALEKEFVGKFLPVVIYNYEPPVDQTFLPLPTVEVDADGKVTEKSVRSAMNDVRAKMVGNKNNDPDMGLNEGEQTNE